MKSSHALRVIAALSMYVLSACVAVAPKNDTAEADTVAATADTTSTSAPASSDANVTFRAVGQEPGWLLTISDSLRLQWDYNERRLAVATPSTQTSGGERKLEFVHQDTAFTIRIAGKPCADAMSGHRYPATVTLNIGARVLNGCGGEPGALLQGGEWVVESIEGKAIASGITITMQFDADGRISGKVCNRYSGNYSTSGNDLVTSQIISTKMACTPEIDQYETQLFSILGAPARFYIEGDVLTIERDHMPVVTARRR